MLEPIFEADFEPVSYGFQPMRRAHDAIAEIQRYGTKGYRWVLDADIEACFDTISHSALMDRVRARVKDKRVLALVKAFLEAGREVRGVSGAGGDAVPRVPTLQVVHRLRVYRRRRAWMTLNIAPGVAGYSPASKGRADPP